MSQRRRSKKHVALLLQRKAQRPRRFSWLALGLTLLPVTGALALLLRHESDSSDLQSLLFNRLAGEMVYSLGKGPSHEISWPASGPFDQRLGYTQLPDMIRRMDQNGYYVSQQARQSPAMRMLAEDGYFPPYEEKTSAGLDLRDCQQVPMFSFRQPRQTFESFDSIPPVIVDSLLFIEDRDLLDPQHPRQNPAVNWPRFLRAAWSQLAHRLDEESDSAGGSTLATQIEKFRHSPAGLTTSASEKFHQMVSASLRAYRDGRDTLPVRRRLVLDYMNNVPLAAASGYGEVHGIGDALHVWFDTDLPTVIRALQGKSSSPEQTALALRQILALMISQRRPSWYLIHGRKQLEQLTDSHLRLLASAGIISPAQRDQALQTRLVFRDSQHDPALQPAAFDKGVIQSRNRLVGLLGLPLYATDRLDLQVQSSLNAWLQQSITHHLESLSDPAIAASHGLIGGRLLQANQAARVNYSFTLFERNSDGNHVRVQTDTSGQLFSINEGSKMELGSTAKLRVVATYLEIIAELYHRHSGNPQVGVRSDPLSRWISGYLQRQPDASLQQTLDAAMERRYSASPHEEFFTGGGIHIFGNFSSADNGRNPTLRDSLRRSINLPMVRLLRDLVDYTSAQSVGDLRSLLRNDRDPRRQEYLQRFADREGTRFLGRFWYKYENLQGDRLIETLLEGLKVTPQRLAAVHRYLYPEAGLAEFTAFMQAHLDSALPDSSQIGSLYQQYAADHSSLTDQGYAARAHPLELWLVRYRLEHPDASFSSAVQASSAQRLQAYDWLFSTPDRHVRDTRVRIMLEVEAFLEIHQRWARLGYPFGHLVPSLATALGSSGDRPAALAELMAIIVNDGQRLPTLHNESFIFARGTPWETRMRPRPVENLQVMEPEVAHTLRGLLADVVARGTAGRARDIVTDPAGEFLQVGGKTGTGDNRIETVIDGKVVNSRVRNRTATFVFYLGSRHYGTISAWVDGAEAEGMRFTSSLPVQVLHSMAPLLQDYLNDSTACPLPVARMP